TVSDQKLAEISSRSVGAVQAMRLKCTEVRFPPRRVRPPRQWTEEEKALLGQCTIREAATRLGCSFNAVSCARRQLGIRIRPHSPGWTPETEALVGAIPDKELALRLNRSVTSIQVRRARLGKPKPDPKYRPWTREEEAMLGTASDREIAARIGRQPATVAARRKKLSIPHAPMVPRNAWT